MTRYLITLAISALLVGCAAPSGGSPPRPRPPQIQAAPHGPSPLHAEILWFGDYTVSEAKKIKTPNSLTGYNFDGKGFIPFHNTADISADYAVNFGIIYRLAGGNDGNSIPVRVVVVFPPPGIVSALTGKLQQTLSGERIVNVGSENRIGYRFTTEAEFVPGEWLFQIWYKDHLLAQQVFHVHRS